MHRITIGLFAALAVALAPATAEANTCAKAYFVRVAVVKKFGKRAPGRNLCHYGVQWMPKSATARRAERCFTVAREVAKRNGKHEDSALSTAPMGATESQDANVIADAAGRLKDCDLAISRVTITPTQKARTRGPSGGLSSSTACSAGRTPRMVCVLGSSWSKRWVAALRLARSFITRTETLSTTDLRILSCADRSLITCSSTSPVARFMSSAGVANRPATFGEKKRYLLALRRLNTPYTTLVAGPPRVPPAGTATARAGGTLSAIAACESGGNPSAVGGGGAFRGKYQFTMQTWRSVGGSGDPAAASEAEQDQRAAALYAREGASPWPVCGR